MSLTTWINNQKKMYSDKLWFLKTPGGKCVFSDDPFDIDHLYKYYWCKDNGKYPYEPNNFEADGFYWNVPKEIAKLLPFENGTQIEVKDLISKIKKIEKEGK